MNPSSPSCATGYIGVCEISKRLWKSVCDFRRCGGADDILSRTLSLRSGLHQIVGVVPATFLGVEVGRRFDVALPVCASGFDRRDHWWLAVMGRLAPGWTASGAEAHLAALGPSLLQAAMPANYAPAQARDFRALRFSVHPAANGISPLRAQHEDPLWLLLGIAALVFFTACANVASLSLVRATARQPELGLRSALGATRFRIVRQLVVEGALIGLAGAIAGRALSGMAVQAVMAALSTSTDPIVLDVAPDWRVILFHVAAVGLTTLAFTAGPVLVASRRPHSHDGARNTGSRRFGRRSRSAGVVAGCDVGRTGVSGAALRVDVPQSHRDGRRLHAAADPGRQRLPRGAGSSAGYTSGISTRSHQRAGRCSRGGGSRDIPLRHRARDPRILTLTMAVVVVAALAAAVVPVRRALAIDPVRALKDE